MPNNPSLPDARQAPPPVHQSFWFPVAPESGPEVSQDEPVDEPAPKRAPPAVNGLGWKAPKRQRVRVFERDAAPENTTPGSVPTALVDACIGPDSGLKLTGVRFEGNALVATLRTTDEESVRVLCEALAPAHMPTANDETVRMLREHIVPDPMPPDDPGAHAARRDAAAEFRDRQIAQELLATAGLPSGASPDDEIVRELRAAPPDDPDFQEVCRTPAPETTALVSEADKDIAASGSPPEGPSGRADATPNDGVVPQGNIADIVLAACGTEHRDELRIEGSAVENFQCALWSNGEFTIRPSDGEALVLSNSDRKELFRYVGEVLSARVRAPA